MRRPVVTAVLLCAIAGLAGCPIYDHEDNGCYTTDDCGSPYVCDRDRGVCYLPRTTTCSKPTDCDATSTCTSAAQCSPGDCSFYSGCVAGYRCDSSSGIWQCVSDSAGAAGAAGAAASSGEAASAGASQGGAGGADVPSDGVSESGAGGVAGGG